jgi:cytochrome c-type biogenesis protein CcmH
MRIWGDEVKVISRFTFYVLFLVLAFAFVSTASAQTREVSDDEVNEVAKDLFCPVCESTPLDVCPTQACADWRELIRTQLAEGSSKEDVHEYFARQYGDGVLADPPKRGFNLVLWIFPIVAVLLGGALFARYLLRLRHEHDVTMESSKAEAAPRESIAYQPINPADANPDYIVRIEDELLARKAS